MTGLCAGSKCWNYWCFHAGHFLLVVPVTRHLVAVRDELKPLHPYRVVLGHPGLSADEVVVRCEIPVLFEESMVSDQTLRIEASNVHHFIYFALSTCWCPWTWWWCWSGSCIVWGTGVWSLWWQASRSVVESLILLGVGEEEFIQCSSEASVERL